MKNPDKKRIRGHLLDKIDNLERALISFNAGDQRSKEINNFSREEVKELRIFEMQVSLMATKLYTKLLHHYCDKQLSDPEKSRLPERVMRKLYPTKEQERLDKEGLLLAESYKKLI